MGSDLSLWHNVFVTCLCGGLSCGLGWLFKFLEKCCCACSVCVCVCVCIYYVVSWWSFFRSLGWHYLIILIMLLLKMILQFSARNSQIVSCCNMHIILNLAFPPTLINYATYWALAHPTLQQFYWSIAICRAWSLVYWWWLEYYANWEICDINGWWFDFAKFNEALINSIGGWALEDCYP